VLWFHLDRLADLYRSGFQSFTTTYPIDIQCVRQSIRSRSRDAQADNDSSSGLEQYDC
jgi:hypothetical protein